MRRHLLSVIVAAIVCGFIATPSASAQQSFNLFLGGFTPAPFDARDHNDVLLANSQFLTTLNRLVEKMGLATGRPAVMFEEPARKTAGRPTHA